MNRRDILKLFGAGAAAVPLVNGVAIREAEVVLVEPPKVEPARKMPSSPPHGLYGSYFQRDELTMRVDFYNNRTGEHFQFEAKTFMTEARRTVMDITAMMPDKPFRTFAPGPELPATWELKGIFTGAAQIL